ncbi:MAG TPA: response regulator transcription factor [Gammaproteobacteria bacterium]|nr:response regulator transcription factor [Gammaproteobacteria bacterium]
MYRILLVEDDIEFRSSLVDVLLAAYPHVSILEAGCGREALDVFKATSPDLVFMDIGLPDTDGLDLTRKIRELDPDARVIILTGHNSPEYRCAAETAGASGYVWKGEPSRVLLGLVGATS